MTRPIKFRAWDKKEEIMYYSWNPNNVLVLHEDSWELGEGENEWHVIGTNNRTGILMQYTGLKDKKGKDMYEGDILRVKFKLDKVEDYIYISLSDKEKKEQTVIRAVREIPECYSQPELSADDVEIIGNIYENPKLLDNE